ncbi:MAG TPA: SBBP repeat-containing protein, partial [Myxococcales bacterium]|nr:SBBP repeat-containing protein [Myxococcales bacterium]
MNLRSWMAAACFALALSGTPGCEPTPPPSPYAFPVQLGTAGQDNAFGVAADGSGNVYIAGWTDGVFPGVAAEGYIDLFVVKLDGGGAQQWIQQYGTTKNDYARGVALDGSGNLYVAGYTTGTFPGFTNPGGAELLVIGLDGSGGMRWAQQLGAGDETVANGVATDSNGNVLVAGETFGSLPGFTSTGIVDLFVIKYDGGGARQWIQQMGAGGSLDSTHANGVATDGSGNVYVAGYTSGSFNGSSNAGGH